MHQLIIVLMSIVLTAVMITVTAVYAPASKTTTEINYALTRDGFKTLDKAYQLYTKANSGAAPAVVGQSADGGLATSFSEYLPFTPKAPPGYYWTYGYNSTQSLHYFCLSSPDTTAGNSATLLAYTRVQKIFSASQYIIHNGGVSNCGTTSAIDTSSGPTDVALTYFVRNVEAFSPKAIPGLVVWLDADDPGAIGLNGQGASQWLDKSGNGNNALQNNSGYMPAYSSTALRGRGGLTFARSAFSYMEIPLTTSLKLGAVDVFVAGNISASGSQSTLISSNTTASCSADCFNYSLRQADLGGGYPIDSGIQFSIGSTGAYTGVEPQVNVSALNTTALWEGLYSNGNLGVAQDAINNTVQTGVAMPVSNYNLQLGRGPSAVQGEYLDGVLGEVLIYNRPLTVAERLRLQHYFGRKWSLTNLTN